MHRKIANSKAHELLLSTREFHPPRQVYIRAVESLYVYLWEVAVERQGKEVGYLQD